MLAYPGWLADLGGVGYGDGLNLYAYVRNDPVNRTDPSGLAGCRSGGGVTSSIVDGVEEITITGCTKGDGPGGSGSGGALTGPGRVLGSDAINGGGGGGGEGAGSEPLLPEEPQNDEAVEGEEIVVTGTRIAMADDKNKPSKCPVPKAKEGKPGTLDTKQRDMDQYYAEQRAKKMGGGYRSGGRG